MRVFLGVEALVGRLERLACVGRLVRQENGAERADDLEAFASFGERLAGAVDQRLRLAFTDRRDEAELVSPEPVDGPAVARDAGQLCAEPDEQRVAGRVPEGVVVVLEAVEVEEHEQRLGRALAPEAPLEIREELSPVGETCQGVGGRLLARQLE